MKSMLHVTHKLGNSNQNELGLGTNELASLGVKRGAKRSKRTLVVLTAALITTSNTRDMNTRITTNHPQFSTKLSCYVVYTATCKSSLLCLVVSTYRRPFVYCYVCNNIPSTAQTNMV